MKDNGSLIISLDMELYWGMRDTKSLAAYRHNIMQVHKAIPRILDLFDKYQIHATWAVVGFLFFKDKKELLENLPTAEPGYSRELYNPYVYLRNNDLEESCHFAPAAIRQILNTPHQEIGTHTFSHYFALEEGQSLEQFESDLHAARKIHVQSGCDFKSLVFPRNQYQDDHLKILAGSGIRFYRGNAESWIYKPRNYKSETFFLRVSRFADAYLNLSGPNTFPSPVVNENLPVNIPASTFLRPYSPYLKALEPVRYARIKKSMKAAAIRKENYHMWWHPHNFGKNLSENLQFLEKILKQFTLLRSEYGFQSKSMGDF